jgi:hypothetical protein
LLISIVLLQNEPWKEVEEENAALLTSLKNNKVKAGYTGGN